MRRLIPPVDERGATAVVVALVLVVLMGFGALAVDVSALYWDRQELQNGADAAALALAQRCAAGECAANSTQVARDYAQANKSDGNIADAITLSSGDNSVTVEVTSLRQHWLAPVIGADATKVGAIATASWGNAPRAMAAIPFTASHCKFYRQNGTFDVRPELGNTEVVIEVGSKNSSDGQTYQADGSLDCTDNPNGTGVAGSFGFLQAAQGCSATPDVDGWVKTSTGNGFDNVCSAQQIRDYLGTTPGKVIYLPLFDQVRNPNGNNARFHIGGYAALQVSSYCFNSDSVTMAPVPKGNWKCTGSAGNITGTFIRAATIAELGASGGTDYGLVAVRLTLPTEDH